MTLEPISAAKLIALMLAGGIFALAGLYMMLRPRPEGAAKIELFGLKFESSSAGLLVFLVGSAFLAVSLFVPEKQTVAAQNPNRSAPTNPIETPTTRDENPKPGVVLPSGPDTTESEPNNSVQTANQIALGSTISGNLRTQESDWFVLPTKDLRDKRLLVKVRNLTGASTYVYLYDENEKKVDQEGSISVEAMIASWIVSGDFVFIRLKNETGGGNDAYGYELVTSVEEI